MATAKLLTLVTAIVDELHPLLSRHGGNEKVVQLNELLKAAQAEAAQADNTIPRQIEALQAQVNALTQPAPETAPGDSHG